MKRLLTLLLALGLLGSTIPVMAAEEAGPTPLPAWAYSELADAYAMGLVDDDIYTNHENIITMEQLEKLTKVVADKLALLGVDQRSNAGSVVIDTTRGGVLNALYQEAAPYRFPGIEKGPVASWLTQVLSMVTALTWPWTVPAPFWKPPASRTG